MKKAIYIVFVILALLIAIAPPAYAQWHGHGHGHGHGRFFIGGSVWIGPGWGGWGPWWWGPAAYPYYYSPYYAAPPVTIEQQPQVYVQPAPQPEEQNYWYFCRKPEGYYPYIKQCPSGWLKVVPPSAPPDIGTKNDNAPSPQDQRMKGNSTSIPPDLRMYEKNSQDIPEQREEKK